MSGYLLNTVTIENNSAPLVVKAGTLLTDSGVISAVQNVGGVLASSTDPVIVAAATLVQNFRKNRAINEADMTAIMMAANVQSLNGSALQHVLIDIPLAMIQGETSGTAFNVGSVLPANARLFDAELVVVATVTGGTLSAVTAKVQGGSDTAGSIIGGSGGVDVFTAPATFGESTGSDAYAARGGQQIKMTLTASSDTLNHATTGHLQLSLYYSVLA
jgi:hypothetical protein